MINTASDYLTVQSNEGYAGGEAEFDGAQKFDGAQNYIGAQDFHGAQSFADSQDFSGAQDFADSQDFSGAQDFAGASDYTTPQGHVDAQNCSMSGRGMNMNTRQTLLARVNEAGFCLDDAQLYLDTHPCDQAALAYFQQVSAMYHNAVSAYSAQFGPLIAADSTDVTYWSWISDPWPWEGGFN